MKRKGISRRDMLKGGAALAAGSALSTRVLAAAPPPEAVTPALIEAAKKEGQVIHYTSTDLPVAEKLAKFRIGLLPKVDQPHAAWQNAKARQLPACAQEDGHQELDLMPIEMATDADVPDRHPEISMINAL